MGIVEQVYESKIVDKVNLRDILRILGMPEEKNSTDSWVYFDSPEFVAMYLKHKQREQHKQAQAKSKNRVREKVEKFYGPGKFLDKDEEEEFDYYSKPTKTLH